MKGAALCFWSKGPCKADDEQTQIEESSMKLGALPVEQQRWKLPAHTSAIVRDERALKH
jgi:hypothetical protein